MKYPNCGKQMTEKEEFIPSLTYEGGDNWETVFVCKECKIKYSDTFDRWTIPKNYAKKCGLKFEDVYYDGKRGNDAAEARFEEIRKND